MLIEEFTKARPYLFHLTHRDNLRHIRELGCLLPASTLMQRANHPELIRTVRRGSRQLSVDGRAITIRDQDKLHKGNMRAPDGFAFEDLVEILNGRVFFWPGAAGGPISYGIRHFERYRSEKPVILRIGSQSLLAVNAGAVPRFCRYNSGSPRCSNGKGSPRGPETFKLSGEFHETPSKVIEVTFDQPIALPQETEYGAAPNGPWHSLT